jgi:hypothetical protein
MRELIAYLLAYLFACPHRNFSTPRCGRQVCFDCGAERRYRSFGAEPGAWTRRVVELQSSRGIASRIEVQL